MTTLEKRFIQDTIKRLSVYKDLGDKTFAQLSEEDMNDSANEESNSIAVIVQHLHGNMMNRFTSFLTEDGENYGANAMLNLQTFICQKKKSLLCGVKAGNV